MKLTTTLLALTAMTYSASAATVAINFMRNGSTTPAANDGSEFAISTWVDFDANLGSPAVVSGITVAWTAGGTWSGGSANNVENGYIDNTTTMTLSGLSAWLGSTGDTQYTIQLIQANDTNNGFQNTDLFDTDSGGTALGTLTNANDRNGATTVSNQLTADTLFLDTATGVGGSRSGVAGIIITSTIPEPSSTALLGLGSLVLLIRRNK